MMSHWLLRRRGPVLLPYFSAIEQAAASQLPNAASGLERLDRGSPRQEESVRRQAQGGRVHLGLARTQQRVEVGVDAGILRRWRVDHDLLIDLKPASALAQGDRASVRRSDLDIPGLRPGLTPIELRPQILVRCSG